MRYFCICAGYIYQVNDVSSNCNDSVWNHVPRTCSSSYVFSSSRQEDKPLLNNVPLHDISHDNQANNNQLNENRISPMHDYEKQENTDLNQKIAMEQLRRTLKHLEDFIMSKETEYRMYRQSRREWKSIAIVMDRCFFILYMIFIITSISAMFPRP